MPNILVALMAAVGFGGWAYTKASRRTGGNTNSSLIAAVTAGVFALIVMLTLLSALDGFLAR